MSTATLIRSPADCLAAVLTNLEYEHRIVTEQAERYRRCAAKAQAEGDVGKRHIADDLADVQDALAKQIRDHQALIRTECAAFLHDGDSTAQVRP